MVFCQTGGRGYHPNHTSYFDIGIWPKISKSLTKSYQQDHTLGEGEGLAKLAKDHNLALFKTLPLLVLYAYHLCAP